MAGTFRTARIGALVLVVALVAGGCGGKDNNNKVSAKSRKTTTTESLNTDETSTTGAGATTTVKGATTTTVKGGAATTTAKSGAGAPPPQGTAAPNAAPAPAQQGTYDYAQSGSTSQGDVPPNGTLDVGAAAGASQTFSRKIDPNEQPSDIFYVFRSDGPFITRVVVRNGSIAITCTFGSPVPAPPWPATDGSNFNGHATCDNGFAADFSGSITGHKTDSVGGKSVPVVVISSNLHIVGNRADITTHDTEDWAPSLRVPTYSHQVISGTAPFVGAVRGDVTSTLKSTSPH